LALAISKKLSYLYTTRKKFKVRGYKMNLKNEMIGLGQKPQDLEELRGGHTLDKLPKDFLIDAPRNGYAVAVVENLIDTALRTTQDPDALSIARQITPKLEDYFKTIEGKNLAAQLEATKLSGVKMQEKLTRAQIEATKTAEKLINTEELLEQAYAANKKMHTGMSIYEERIGTLIDIIKNISASK
jgi:hypothetical protein